MDFNDAKYKRIVPFDHLPDFSCNDNITRTFDDDLGSFVSSGDPRPLDVANVGFVGAPC